MKGSASAPARPMLGDGIHLFIPQVVTMALLSANPAFARLLYRSGYSSAKRNAYFIMRRLDMPADFFWKFELWDDERAFTTLRKVVDRIFTSLMSRHNVGLLALDSVDVDRYRFEVSYASCAECFGLTSTHPVCFFHAGVFAGILGAMLDRDLDAHEEACTVSGARACRFKIGTRSDRAIAAPLDEQLNNPAVTIDVSQQAQSSFEEREAREIGNLVDIGYYQLLLSSSFLTNLPMLDQACFSIGAEIGKALAPLLPRWFEGDAAGMIGEFYRRFRYMEVGVADLGDAIDVQVAEAPEALGPLADTSLVPFLSGELESLLSKLTERPVTYDSMRSNSSGLLLRFAPQA